MKPGTIEFYRWSDEAMTTPTKEFPLEGYYLGKDFARPGRHHYSTYSAGRIRYMALWLGRDVCGHTLDLAFFKMVGGQAQFCMSDPFVRDFGSEHVDGAPASDTEFDTGGWTQLNNFIWGPGEYELRLFDGDFMLAAGRFSLGFARGDVESDLEDND